MESESGRFRTLLGASSTHTRRATIPGAAPPAATPVPSQVLTSRHKEKGLTNKASQNHCFMNVIIQAIFHTPALRQRLTEIELAPQHANHSNSECVLCALVSLTTQYEFSGAPALVPDDIRSALAKSFEADGRFALGQFGDAAEALDGVLSVLHVLVTKGNLPEQQQSKESKGKSRAASADSASAPPAPAAPSSSSSSSSSSPSPSTPTVAPGSPSAVRGGASLLDGCALPCIVHSTFGLTFLERQECTTCQALGEPYIYSSFMTYVPVDALLSLRVKFPQEPFDTLIKRATELDTLACPGWEKGCKGKGPPSRYLLSGPDVFVIGMVWTSSEPSRGAIGELLSIIAEEIDLTKMLGGATEVAAGYRLKGMVNYYGHHYDAYWWNASSSTWVVTDDSRVIDVGSSLGDVGTRSLEGKLQPSLLFYEAIREGDAPRPDALAELAQSTAPPPSAPPPSAAPRAVPSASGSSHRSRPPPPPVPAQSRHPARPTAQTAPTSRVYPHAATGAASSGAAAAASSSSQPASAASAPPMSPRTRGYYVPLDLNELFLRGDADPIFRYYFPNGRN